MATGADYRRLEVEGCARFEGSGVFYAATPNEVQQCRGANVVVVGGGNSAGQAAVFLAGQASQVFILHPRRRPLQADVDVSRAAHRADGEHRGAAQHVGGAHARRRPLVDDRGRQRTTGEQRTLQVAALFSFIGAVPRTDWLPEDIETDAKGFVRTGPAVEKLSDGVTRREPFLLETSRRGVFAAGDVRASSVKRVASAVGEGSMAIQFVHEYLKEM